MQDSNQPLPNVVVPPSPRIDVVVPAQMNAPTESVPQDLPLAQTTIATKISDTSVAASLDAAKIPSEETGVKKHLSSPIITISMAFAFFIILSMAAFLVFKKGS